MRAEEFAQLLGSVHRRFRRLTTGQWSGQCPAHDDQHESLTFADGAKGLVVRCHAGTGCPIDAIAAAVGMPVASFFTQNNDDHREPAPDRPRLVAAYKYHDEAGALLYEVVRFEPKAFRQRRPDGRGGWLWSLNGVRRVLYRLPALMGVPTVHIPEGEKDADRLTALGFPATTNPQGAGKWTKDYTDQLRAAGTREAVIFPDNDDAGRDHANAVARSSLAAGLAVKIVQLPALPLKGDVSTWLDTGHTADELQALIASTAAVTLDDMPRPEERSLAKSESPWTVARSVVDFIAEPEPTVAWLEEPFLSPGAVTELAAPRGLGKTHVAYALGLKLARRGVRVLLLDRDNPRREVRRRLRAWGAADAPLFKVMTRDQVPSLTDPTAWKTFPLDYDAVIIDSLDATTEGVGEKDSSRPSRAMAPVLDIARRTQGPAFLILGNTIKSGEHSRGSGVIEDRGDIVFEVRDATNFTPTGTKDWWLELPRADAGAWGERAGRRKRRDSYRLAFVPSKFRIGEEPEPFLLEIELSSEPWILRNVTAEVVEAGVAAKSEAEAAQAARVQRSVAALEAEIQAQAASGAFLTHGEAVKAMVANGLSRARAREIIAEHMGVRWASRVATDQRGRPRLMIPAATVHGGDTRQSPETAAEITNPESAAKRPSPGAPVSADRINMGRQEPHPRQAAPIEAIPAQALFLPTPGESPASGTSADNGENWGEVE